MSDRVEEDTGQILQRNQKARVTVAGGKQENINSRLQNLVNTGSKQIRELSKTFRRRPADFIIPPYPFEDLATLMESNPTHYACVMAKASAISSVGWKVVANINEMQINSEIMRLINLDKRTQDDEKQLDDLLAQIAALQVEQRILEEFFTHPNPSDSFSEINLRTDIDNQAIGNAFWEIVRDFGGRPKSIFHMPTITTRLLLNRTGVAQVRAPSYPLQPVVRPSQDEFGPYLVYFKFFNDPWIMDWRTGKIHGVLIATEEVSYFLSVNLYADGNPLYEAGEYPPGMDPSPPGYTALWKIENSNTQPLEPQYWANEVMWYKRYSCKWADGYGIPDIVAALQACAGDQGAHRFQLDFFENFAVPRMLIALKGFPPGDPEEENDPVSQLRTFFDLRIRGQAHKTVIMETPPEIVNTATGVKQSAGEVQIEKLSAEVDEASFIGYLKHNRDEIIRVERVPLELIASLDVPLRPTATGVSIGLEVFKSFVIRPEQDVREQRINKLIQQGFGFDWHFEFLTIDSLDELREMEIAKGYYEMNVWTINEVRRRLGYDNLPGGDRPFILSPMGLVFIDELEKMTTSQLSQTPNNPLNPAAQGMPQGRGNKKPGNENVKQNPGTAKNAFRNQTNPTDPTDPSDSGTDNPLFSLLLNNNNDKPLFETAINPRNGEPFVPVSFSFGVRNKNR